MNWIWVGLKYYLQISIKYFCFYFMLPLVLYHTVILFIHSFSNPQCSTLYYFPCVQVLWSCNLLPCSCHVHVSSNIFRNMQALANEVVLGEVLCRQQQVCWYFSAYFPTVGEEDSHELLVMGENLLHTFYSSCSYGWLWVFRGDTVCHICLMFKFGREADHNVFHNVCLAVTSLFQSQLSGTSEFWVLFSKMSF